MSERLAIGLSRGLAPDQTVAAIQAAEAAGYESAWVTEGHGGDHFAILAAAARETSRIGLGTAVTSVYVRSAPTIAMAAATVDQLSQGRFTLGLGSSHRVQVIGEHGLDYRQPLQRVRETVAVARALLRDGVVRRRDALITIDEFDLWFWPARPDAPVYVAAQPQDAAAHRRDRRRGDLHAHDDGADRRSERDDRCGGDRGRA